MIRSIVAVIVGFLITTLIVMIATVVTVQVMYGGITDEMLTTFMPTPAYLAVNLLSGVLAAVFGGYYTAWIARRLPVRHGIALGAVILIMGVVSLFVTPSGNQPVWYPYAIPVLGAVGAVLGSRLRK